MYLNRSSFLSKPGMAVSIYCPMASPVSRLRVRLSTWAKPPRSITARVTFSST